MKHMRASSHEWARIVVTGLLVPVAIAGIAGCSTTKPGENNGGPVSSPGERTGATLKIAVIPKGTSHEYWKSVHAGAIKAMQDLNKAGHKIDIVWKGSQKEDDRNSQIDLVQTFITSKISGMVLAPLDDHALVGPVEQAAADKIPVVIIDSSIKTDKYVSFVATDNYKGGQMGADQLAKVMGGKGKAILMKYEVNSASTEAREKGFLNEMKKYPGITFLSDDQYGGATTDTAYQMAQNLLNRFGHEVQGVFTPNETTTRGMLKALQQASLAGKVKFVGFDTAPDLVGALQNNTLQGLVAQDPFKMGYEGLTTLVDYMDGKKVPKSIDTGAVLITPQNVNSAKLHDLLNPPLKKYLNE